MTADGALSWLDYAVFAGCISLSVGTGVYHAVRSGILMRREGGRRSAKEEYLMGGRQMPALPVALSLLTTFLSGILMLGVPAEMFERGTHIWLNFVVGAISSLITAVIFLPVFHKMKSTCLHEFFNHRYNSWLLRRLFSSLFLLFTIVYMAIVIYAPSVALSPVLKIDKWILILILGASTTLYTTIGGLKAVVWADSLQAVLMYGGVLSLIFSALNNPRVGSLTRVWDLAKDTGRVDDLFRSHPSLLQYNSLWINLVSGVITWLASFGVNQLAIQRYASLPSLQHAQSIIYFTVVPFIVLCSIVAFVGFLALAYFYNCHPLEAGLVKELDHITILFAKEILQPTPGLFGLYVSCIMSATLSTLSSGMNSIAAAVYEDFLKRRLDGHITDHRATQLNKLIVVLSGLVATCLAFLAEPLGGILRVCVSVMGAMSGPMVAIFVLALFFPRVGEGAAVISFVASNLIMMFICVVNYLEDPFRQLFLPTNTSREGCVGSNVTLLDIREQPPFDAHFGDPSTSFIARISTYSYAGLGFFLMLAIALPLGRIYKEEKSERIAHLTFAGRNLPWPESDPKQQDRFLPDEEAAK